MAIPVPLNKGTKCTHPQRRHQSSKNQQTIDQFLSKQSQSSRLDSAQETAEFLKLKLVQRFRSNITVCESRCQLQDCCTHN